MKRVIQYLFVSLMFVVPVTGFLSSDPSYVIKSENRTLAKFPKYGSNEYFSDLVKWYTDRLFGKISISEKYFSLFNSVFADYSFSPNRQSVKGESNWFFLGNYAYYQHSREVTIPLSKTNRKIAFLKELRNSSNAPFYLVVGPDKHGVYSEFLRPYIYEPGKYRSFDNYKHYLTDNGIDYIDNLDSILAEKSNLKNNQTLYYTNDTHWNSYGAYVAFNNVMRHIVDNYDPIKYSFIFSSNLTGDLTRNIVAPKHRFLDDVKVKSIQKNIKDFNVIENRGDALVKKFENELAKDNRTVLIMADSFGGAFAPFAIDYFKRVILLPRVETEGLSFVEIIKKEKPDIVLYINVERNVFFD